MMQRNVRSLWVVFFFSLLWAGEVKAQDLDALLHNNEVKLQTWLSPSLPPREKSSVFDFSVNEQIILTIDVATTRWFTGGTRIGRVDIPNVIAMQRNQLAVNIIEHDEENTWSHQRWEVTLYPQASGTFVIPPVAVGIQVSASDGQKISGTLYTPSLSFKATLPSGLCGDTWFAATQVSVEQLWETSADELKVGDAITRKVSVSAQDSLSVLLPNVLKSDSTTEYQTYPQPHQLMDTQTRGDYQSTKIEENVYVAQRGGELTLPDRTFHWWNTKTHRVETVVLKGKTFEIKHTLRSFIRAYWGKLMIFLGGLASAAFMCFSAQRYFRTHPFPTLFVLYRLLKTGQWADVRRILYREWRLNTAELEMCRAETNGSWYEDALRLQQGEQNVSLVMAIWRRIRVKRQWVWRPLPKALPELDKVRPR
ncbi:MAG: BatD family protein [Vibrio fluvialis]